MNQLERTIKRVVESALLTLAKSLDRHFGDGPGGLSEEDYAMLGVEIEAVVEKTLREAGIFPDLKNGWPDRRKKAAA
jgi:hypothetical protein